MDLLERDAALGNLDSAFEHARRGQGRTVLISGEPGIGKTSLVEHFAQQQRSDVRVLWGGCDALFTPRPLGPLHDIAEQAGGTLATLLNGSTTPGVVFGAVLAELQRLPTVTIIEDIHWADDGTLDVLRYVGRRIGRTSALLVLTCRDDDMAGSNPLRAFLGDLASSGATLRIHLPPLSEHAVAKLVGPRSLDASALHRQTGGNPFFLTEILASSGPGLPLSVRDAVMGRIARLSCSARSLLEAAAISGARAESWLLEAIVPEAFAALDECLAAGMLIDHGDSYAFRHELARQAVLESIPPVRRAELHRLVLRTLESLPGGPADVRQLAHHAEGANELQAIMAYVPAAARKASAAGAHRAAADLLAKSLRRTATLGAADLATLFEAHAMESYHIADMPQAIASWRQAIERWHTEGNRRREGMNLAVLAASLASAGARQDARTANHAALELLSTETAGRELALALGTQAILHQYSQELAEAIALARRAIALAEQAGDRQILVMAYDTLGMSTMFSDYERGCEYLEHARDLARDAGLDAAVARAYGDLGAISVALLRLERAEQYLSDGLTYTADRDLDRTRLYTLAWFAAAQLLRGRWLEAVSSANEVLRHQASSSARVTALLTLGRLAARRGESGTASSLLDQALSLAGAPDELRQVGPVRAARAEAAALAGDAAASRAEAEAAYALALERHHPWVAAELAYWGWKAGVADDPPDWLPAAYRLQIEGQWRVAAEAWRGLGCPYEEARALAEGDLAAQERALGIFDRLEARAAAGELRRGMRVQGVRMVPRGPQRATRANRYGLTSRQVEILLLLGEGCTNAEIAQRMSIAPKTAEHHVAAVLAKLEVDSRQAAVRLARDQQLIS
jgi:DNA-binding CsgD family transcriptional regulator/tetratricopeptide (TPR) repeat protein